jgi:hypothetical protein
MSTTNPSSSSPPPAGTWWQRNEKRLFGKYHGVEGGVLLRSTFFTNLGRRFPLFRKCNNALWAAPAFKWGLSIVPLYGILQGKPKVEDLDLKQSLALSFTGLVWSYYGFLVEPRADLLIAVNVALLTVNGYNVFRKLRYEQQKKAASETEAH